MPYFTPAGVSFLFLGISAVLASSRDIELIQGSKEIIPCTTEQPRHIQTIQWFRTDENHTIINPPAAQLGGGGKGGFRMSDDNSSLVIDKVTIEHEAHFACVITTTDGLPSLQWNFCFSITPNRGNSDVHLLSGATERVPLLHRWRTNFLPIQWCKLTDGDRVLGERLTHLSCDDPTKTSNNFEIVEKLYLQVTKVTPDQAGWYKFIVTRNDSLQQTELVFRIEVHSNSMRPDVYLLTGARELIKCVSPWQKGLFPVTWYRIGKNGTRKIAKRSDETSHPFDSDFNIVEGNLVVNNVSLIHEGSYQCVIERLALSQQTELIFKFIVKVNDVGSSVHLVSGTAHVVPCINVQGVQPDVLSVAWYRLGEGTTGKRQVAYWNSGQSSVFEHGLETVSNSSLIIRNVIPKHGGHYACIMQRGNSAQQTEVTFNFTVQTEAAYARWVRISVQILFIVIAAPLLCLCTILRRYLRRVPALRLLVW